MRWGEMNNFMQRLLPSTLQDFAVITTLAHRSGLVTDALDTIHCKKGEAGLLEGTEWAEFSSGYPSNSSTTQLSAFQSSIGSSSENAEADRS